MTDLNRPLTIMLAAIEPSGDALGAALYSELKKLAPAGSRFLGCGGPQMEAAGFVSAFPVDAFAVMGFTDVIKVIPEGMKRARELANLAAREKADIVIFVDGWTFSRIGAKRFSEISPDSFVIKYAAPQIWASRPQRIDFVKKYFDAVLTLLPFEAPIFEKAGIPARYTGNSNYQKVQHAAADGAGFREKYDLGSDKILILCPGSRSGEVTRLAPAFSGAVAALRKVHPDLEVLMAAAPSKKELTQNSYEGMACRWIEPDERYDAFAAADAALAASGTVTTELAILRTPMAVAYRVDALTYFWAQRVMITEFVTILNIAAGREIIPEYLQDDCEAALLASELENLLYDGETARQQLSDIASVMPQLGLHESDPAKRAAEAALELYRQSAKNSAG